MIICEINDDFNHVLIVHFLDAEGTEGGGEKLRRENDKQHRRTAMKHR